MTLNTDLSAEIKVVAFAGSLRADSVNKKLVKEAAGIAKELGANVTLIDLKDYPIPFYDGDLEQSAGMPGKAQELRKLMVDAQVVMIATPEYNGSLSAVLKNAIDWASRSVDGKPSREAFKGDRKFVIMAASPGALGGTRALGHLRTIIENVGGTVTSQQFSLPDAYNAFDPAGHLKNPEQKNDLRRVVQAAIQ